MPNRYTYVKEYMLQTEYIPQYIYWIDGENILLSSYGYTEIYNIQSRKKNTIPTCDTCIYGYDRGFVKCEYMHRSIESMEEYSTTISIYDSQDTLIGSEDIFPTVVPIYCTKDIVLLKSAYSFLEQKTYIYDVGKDSIGEYSIDGKKEMLSGIQEEYITLSKRNDLDKIIVLDMNYNLWVYSKKQLPF